MKGNQETKIKKAISPEGGGGYSEIISEYPPPQSSLSLEIISRDREFLSVKFFVLEFFSVGKFSNYFLGGLI